VEQRDLLQNAVVSRIWKMAQKTSFLSFFQTSC